MLTARGSLLLIVDVQASLARAVEDAARCIHRTRLLLTAARELRVPVIVSEQYPEGLGPTDARLLDQLGDAIVLPKRAFSCWREPYLATRFRTLSTDRRRQSISGVLLKNRSAQLMICASSVSGKMSRGGNARSLAMISSRVIPRPT